jgi:hypothetical protein
MTLESRVRLTLHARFGKGSTEKVLATGTSPAIYFTSRPVRAGGRWKRTCPAGTSPTAYRYQAVDAGGRRGRRPAAAVRFARRAGWG